MGKPDLSYNTDISYLTENVVARKICYVEHAKSTLVYYVVYYVATLRWNLSFHYLVLLRSIVSMLHAVTAATFCLFFVGI